MEPSLVNKINELSLSALNNYRCIGIIDKGWMAIHKFLIAHPSNDYDYDERIKFTKIPISKGNASEIHEMIIDEMIDLTHDERALRNGITEISKAFNYWR